MAIRIGINGFGRIGRITLRAIRERYGNEFDVVAINDLTDAHSNAHLFKYDTTYGVYPGTVKAEEKAIFIDGDRLQVFAERDPSAIPWGDVGADIVIESTGFFTDAEKASAHLKSGAKKVIISAPAKNEDITLVMGVNHEKYDPASHHVVSNASCTTNCLAPVAKVLNDTFGIEQGIMTTVHSYTNDQKIQDQVHSDLRRARAAAANIIPTSTGAAKAIYLALPELKGKLNGVALRVPTLTVSLVDLVVTTAKPVSVESANAAFKAAAEGALQGYLGVEEAELVSSDFRGDSRSSIVDLPSTMAMGDHMLKVFSWYDNEWGYSCRVGDLAKYMSEKGL
ncbi:MAG: type I glyceraldehyde-3-phosphate dehydrogenase [Fimbriimonadia bacterium]|nr:type I glyceraldehyde-3-phosphate dehydrogenase [Fimbriimonadia bacterium]